MFLFIVTVRKVKPDTKEVEWKENLTIDDLSELSHILKTSFEVSADDDLEEKII